MKIVLDRTAFYPESGGQSGDRGTITDGTDTVDVIDTRKSKGMVVHLVDGGIPFAPGDLVHGELDWNRRYPCMRFHTAQHILSRYLQLNYGLETVGNMIKPYRSHADYSPLDSFDDDMKHDVEAGVNEILARNLDVRIEFMPHLSCERQQPGPDDVRRHETFIFQHANLFHHVVVVRTQLAIFFFVTNGAAPDEQRRAVLPDVT